MCIYIIVYIYICIIRTQTLYIYIYIHIHMYTYIYIYVYIRPDNCCFETCVRLRSSGCVPADDRDPSAPHSTSAKRIVSYHVVLRCIGRHCLSNATCLIRPHLFYALLIVSRITIVCNIIRRF